jgi:NACHT domain
MRRGSAVGKYGPLLIAIALTIVLFALLTRSAKLSNWVLGVSTVLGAVLAVYGAFIATAGQNKTLDRDEYEEAVAKLAERVTREEALERQRLLLGRAMRPARMRLRGATFLPSYNTNAQPDRLDSPTLFDTFWNRLDPRRMVLLGEPGAGKTLLLLELIHQAAEARNADPSIPIFIRVNVAQWPDSQTFADFFAQRVSEQHFMPLEVVRSMFERGRIAPLLDGLDEFDRPDDHPTRGRDAVRRINRIAAGSYPLGAPLVMMCRRSYFELLERAQRGEAPDDQPIADDLADEVVGVHGASYFLVDPLDADQISAYLRDNLPDVARRRWEPITAELRSRYPSPVKTNLVSVLGSPWRLMLAFRAYRERGAPADVLFRDDIELVEARLLPQFLAVAMQWRGRQVKDIGDGYGLQQTWLKPVASDSVKVARWLKHIAVWLQGDRDAGGGAGELVPYRVYQMVDIRLFRSVFALYALVTGVAAGTLVAVVAVNGAHSFFRDVAIATAAIFLVGGMATALLGAPTTPAGMSVARQVRTPKGLADLAIALFCALAASAFTLGTGNSPAARVLGGVCCGLISGLFFGFVLAKRLRAREVEMANSLTPSDPLRGGLGNSAVLGIVVAAIYGVTIFLLGDGVLTAVIFAVCTLVVFAPIMGMPLVSMAWSRYRIAVFILFLQRRLPWRIVTFLEWSYGSGLMRTAGLSYQFRHLRLQTWLADTPEPELLPRSRPG